MVYRTLEQTIYDCCCQEEEYLIPGDEIIFWEKARAKVGEYSDMAGWRYVCGLIYKDRLTTAGRHNLYINVVASGGDDPLPVDKKIVRVRPNLLESGLRRRSWPEEAKRTGIIRNRNLATEIRAGVKARNLVQFPGVQIDAV